MYNGYHERVFNIYTDKTNPRGNRFAMFHIYQCEHCKRESAVKFKADEPFYCRECNHLIQVNPELANVK